jgi:hypothetical protein
MESIRVPYKQDDFGNDIFARVSWKKHETQSPKPIGIVNPSRTAFARHSADVIKF